MTRYDERRIELRERLERECALGKPRVRNGQAGLVDELFPEDEKVEVDRARPVARAALAHPAELLLDAEQDIEQRSLQRARSRPRAHRSESGGWSV